jgi:DNA-binding MarR family transcriptional regulator
MDKLELLKSLIPYIEEYQAHRPNSGSKEDFLNWLKKQDISIDKSSEGAPQPWTETTPITIARLVIALNRYARVYFKYALEQDPIQNIDELVYLFVLMDQPEGLSKTEVIQMVIQEKSTGMEILRRLIANGWIVQKNTDTDKRERKVSLSPKGVQLLWSTLGKIGQVADIIRADLSDAEQQQLMLLLMKLEKFHEEKWKANQIQDMIKSKHNLS